MNVGRYAVAGLLAFVLLVGLMLLVRPLIFSIAPPRDDSSYAVAATSELAQGPILRELPLNASHGLPGEQPREGVPVVAVVLSLQPGGDPAAVNAWSPTHGCRVTVDADRLRDCGGDSWTFEGVPIDAGLPTLQRFPARAAAGAVIVDFTEPLAPG